MSPHSYFLVPYFYMKTYNNICLQLTSTPVPVLTTCSCTRYSTSPSSPVSWPLRLKAITYPSSLGSFSVSFSQGSVHLSSFTVCVLVFTLCSVLYVHFNRPLNLLSLIQVSTLVEICLVKSSRWCKRSGKTNLWSRWLYIWTLLNEKVLYNHRNSQNLLFSCSVVETFCFLVFREDWENYCTNTLDWTQPFVDSFNLVETFFHRET